MVEPKRVLITGAASGIGKACVQLMADDGYSVIACDIDEEGLSWARPASHTEAYRVVDSDAVSRLTRQVQPTEEAYEVAMAAQRAGVEAVRPGVIVSEVHRATRQVIVDGCYREWFRHRTGHCIRLDVHEEPFISEEDDTPLEVSMTFTIEPGLLARPSRSTC